MSNQDPVPVSDSETEDDTLPNIADILDPDEAEQQKALKVFTPLRILVVFTFVNVLNYIDRGIVSGAGTTIEGCDSSCTGPDDYCWDNVTQKSCGHHYYRQFCSNLNETCQQQFGADVPMCVEGFNYSINDANCTNPDNVTACPPCCISQTGFSIDTEQLGWLQFAFLIGYMPSMLVFGHLVRTVRPFKLMGSGLSIWCCAVLASGFAGPHFVDSYPMMLAARAVSGVGEASFQCIGPPFIDDYAPKAQKGVWLAIFYSAIPCGTALGFVWAGEIAKALSWEWAFIIECPIMLPIAIMCFFVPLKLKNTSGGHGHGHAVELDSAVDESSDDDLLSNQHSAHAKAATYGRSEDLDPYGSLGSTGRDDLRESLVNHDTHRSLKKHKRPKKDGENKKVNLWDQVCALTLSKLAWP